MVGGGGGGNAAEVRKELRRRTLYLPSDDTTILTIHPGSIRATPKPVSHLVMAGLSINTEKGWRPDGTNPRMQRTERASLAAAPKRAPLQPTLKTVQESWSSHDRPGSGPGKENMAPKTASVRRSWKDSGTSKPDFQPCRMRAKVGQDLVRAVISPISEPSLKLPKPDRPSVRCLHDAQPMRILRAFAEIPCDDVFDHLVKPRFNNTPLNLISPNGPATHMNKRTAFPLAPQKTSKVANSYPLLHEDICRPEMYEETWMSDQESALAQLFNGLFEAADAEGPSKSVSHEENRRILLRLYQEPRTVLLFKRLQASIRFGALSAPNDSMKETSRLKNDVGFQRKFISAWTKTFDLANLRAAAEVVIGREVPACLIDTNGRQSNSPRTPEMLKKSLENFLDACLLRNEDALLPKKASPTDTNAGFTAWCWQRTMLRSLMMIFLLDKSKESELIHGNLFLRTSDFKSTQEFLKGISRLLLPSVGDISRPLARLEFHGSHVQYPLDEYDYRVENLATQFRDGIRFTRLVELLLYSPETLLGSGKDPTVTIFTGEILTTLVGEKKCRVLSQHLKFPCLGRSQKVYNTQLALRALQGVRGAEQIVNNVTAEDFVNGHREKTIITLWGLVEEWGLSTLVNCAELSKEIRRLESLHVSRDGRDCANDKDNGGSRGLEKPVCLLKVWVHNIARLHGLTISNLTTSFANGKVFTAILDEYERYLPHVRSTAHASVNEKSPLETRLKQIGCSPSFGKFFSSFPHV